MSNFSLAGLSIIVFLFYHKPKSNGASQAWTDTSETMSQKETFPSFTFSSQVFYHRTRKLTHMGNVSLLYGLVSSVCRLSKISSSRDNTVDLSSLFCSFEIGFLCCSPGCLGICSVGQAGLKFKNLSASAPRVLGLCCGFKIPY